jgi:hypothetical protein
LGLFRKSFILFTLLYVLFFVKTWGSVSGNIYSHDDVVYYAQTASLVNDFDIDFKNNLGPYNNIYLGISPDTGRMMGYQPLGTTLLYLIPYAVTKPFVYMISIFRGVVFDQYDPLFFVVLCFLILILFYAAGLFIRKTLQLFFEQSLADITAIFLLWGTILPVYIFRRPIFSVIPEFFFASFLVYCFAKIYNEDKVDLLKSGVLGMIFGLLAITRWNDIYLLPLCFVFLGALSKDSDLVCRITKVLLNYLVFILGASIFLILQIIVWIKTYGSIGSFLSYYYQLHAQDISSKNVMFVYLRNVLYVLFGLDWGVVFTMPILLLGGLSFIFRPKIRILKNKALISILLLFIFWSCFHVVLQWKDTGEFFGYRFLISLLPFSAIGFATLLEKFWKSYKKIAIFVLILFCAINFLSILPFELTEKTTLHQGTLTPMGGKGWGNNYYYINSLRFYIESDFKTLFTNFSRGYLGAIVFGTLYAFGVDLAHFSQKVKDYFSLLGYKNYIVFIYLFLVIALFYYIQRLKNKTR